MRKLLYSTLFLSMMAFVFSSCKKEETATPTDPTATTITDGTDSATGKTSVTYKDNGKGTGTVTWSKDKVYVLDGFVFVNDGQTLTIEAGTVIKGKPGTAASASALVVARGGKIEAVGTAAAPIIFTAENDPLDGSLGTQTGLWGGLIVLGKAGLNSGVQTAIEGIPDTETRGIYGGAEDTDNSGTLKYISIRHGGTNIGANNEINGLTLGGVGSATTIDYVEVFANQDDGIEFFGGTVSVSHAVVSYCGDDNVDYDEGYRGTSNQFYFIYQATSAGDRGGEHDGGTSPEDGTPYATPKFYNVTYVGNGGKKALTFRDNAGGEYYNSIFFNWVKGVDIEFIKDGESSKKRFDASQLKLENNTFSNITAGTTGDKLFVPAYVKDDNDAIVADKYPADADRTAFTDALTAYFTSAGNTATADVISRANVVPTADNATVTTGAPTTAAYRGAFAAGQTPWYSTWTALSAQNLVK